MMLTSFTFDLYVFYIATSSHRVLIDYTRLPYASLCSTAVHIVDISNSMAYVEKH